MALCGAGREEANAFLNDQRAFIADQRHLVRLQAQELTHEQGLRHWSLWVRHASCVLKLALEVCIGLLLLALVAGVSLMVWNAAHSDGLVIESFSVPTDMAARGFTGQVIATKTLDELIKIQNGARTSRAGKSFANNWGDDIKVEIPDTGISVGEAFRFLKIWLGHETHINGEITRTAAGIAITARVSGDTGAAVTGSEAELDALVHKAAENIYGATQPYRYGVYLQTKQRGAEAIAVYRALATSGPAQERAWGYIGWANVLTETSGNPTTTLLEKALAVQPDNILALNNLTAQNERAGREEEELHLGLRLLAAMDSNSSATIKPVQLSAMRKGAEANFRAQLLGDWQQAAQRNREEIDIGANTLISPSY